MVSDSAPSLRIVFFGTPDFAVPTLERLFASRHRVVGIVTQPDRPSGRGQRPHQSPVKRVALGRDIPVLQPERLKDGVFLPALTAWGADLGVVAAYGKILNESVLETPRLGFINVHASLLPKFRGAAPIQRAVMAGENITGVTIIRLVRAMDAGPMLAHASRPIDPDETSDRIERDLAVLGAGLLAGVVENLAAGHVVEVPQDEAEATYAPRLDKSEGLIDWQQPARRVHDQIRGLHPWPHAHTFLEGARYIVLRSRPEEVPTRSGRSGPPQPGEVLEASGDVLRVATGDGAIRIVEIQPEGRRPLATREFLAGHPLNIGSIFSSPLSGA